MFVKTLYNQKPLIFETCPGKELCPYKDWIRHVSNKLILDNDFLYEECYRKLTPIDYLATTKTPW